MGESHDSGVRGTSDVVESLLKVARFRFVEFRDRFGRDPGPNEPLFFDYTQDQPVAAESLELHFQVMIASSATRSSPLPVLKFLGLE